MYCRGCWYGFCYAGLYPDAIKNRFEHPIWVIPLREDYFQSVLKWINNWYGVNWARMVWFLPGIVPGLAFAVNAFRNQMMKWLCNRLFIRYLSTCPTRTTAMEPTAEKEWGLVDLRFERKITGRTRLLLLAIRKIRAGVDAETLKNFTVFAGCNGILLFPTKYIQTCATTQVIFHWTVSRRNKTDNLYGTE